MRRNWFIAALILGLALVANSGAEAVVQTGCNVADNKWIVTRDGPINGGYNNQSCILVIDQTVTPDLQNWQADAKRIEITGTAGTPVVIVNMATNSKLTFDAANGDIVVKFATIKARSAVNFFCSGTDSDPLPVHNCRLDVDDSIVIAAKSLDIFKIPGDPSSGFSTDGNLTVSTVGDIDFQNSTVWGGSGIHFKSSQGAITIFCPFGSVGGPCQDPLVSGVLEALCPIIPGSNPPTRFPCDVQFLDSDALRAVCFPEGPGGIFCGGGNTEARFSAFLDIDITGTTFTFLNHVTFTSVVGGLKAGKKNGLPSKITSDSNFFVTVQTTIDVTDAIWDVGGSLKLTADCVGVAAGAVCIDAKRADMSTQDVMQFTADGGNGIIDLCGGTFDKAGSQFPKFNGGTTPVLGASGSYDRNTVKFTDAQCGGAGTGALIDGVRYAN